jgi:hypothetical protein
MAAWLMFYIHKYIRGNVRPDLVEHGGGLNVVVVIVFVLVSSTLLLNLVLVLAINLRVKKHSTPN